MNAILERVRRALNRRPEGTQGQIDQERETGVSIGLMAQARAAGPEMTPEQQIFLSQSEHGMRERLTVLLGIPHRSLAQEREKLAIEGWLAPPAPVLERRAQAWRPQGFLAPLAAAGAVRPWMLWTGAIAAVGAFGLVQTARLTSAKADLREARDLAEQNFDAAQAWRDRSEQYRLHLIDAANVARQAAAALEAERAVRARAAARERRRVRDLQNVLTGSPDAPDWRLRDAAASESGPPAGTP